MLHSLGTRSEDDFLKVFNTSADDAKFMSFRMRNKEDVLLLPGDHRYSSFDCHHIVLRKIFIVSIVVIKIFINEVVIPTLHEWMNEFAEDDRIKMIVLDLKVAT